MNHNETPVVPSTTTLTENDVYQTIGNSRRRAVINILLSENRTVPLSDLARQIAEVSSELEGTDPNDMYKSVYVSLQQNHLPKLDAQGAVEYDAETGAVSPGPHLYYFAPYIHRESPEWGLARLRELDPTLVVFLVVLGVVLGFLLALVVGIVV
jgi:hypothetical protein